MAGNLVKYIKHKILGGGYKQFSVQECATDSEELIYHQVRASSSCSAPPDLLLVSDRENNLPLRTGMVTTTPSTCRNACPASSNNNPKDPHQHQQQHQQLHKQYSTSYHGCKETNGKNHQKSGGHRLLPDDLLQQPLDNEVQVEAQQSHSSTQRSHHQQRTEEHIRLEEFTCDVSVEGGKSSQPLQFSFTFYDLDGHHGKITKDDIVGIVYTIYESIGKSVVVPHSGSKTINVRLTVSPEDKSSKSSKASKKMTPNTFLLEQPSQKGTTNTSGRRLHRYRPRKLIKSDDEDEDSNSDKERFTSGLATNINTTGHVKYNRVHKIKGDQHCCQLPSQGQTKNVDVNIQDSIYDHMKKGITDDTCGDCLEAVEETQNAAVSPIHNTQSAASHLLNNAKSLANEANMKHAASTRIKLLRKSRKQKYQDCMLQTRQRSLSVGNETTCWNNRHLHKSNHHQHQHELHWEADQQLTNTDVLDGVQLRNPYPFQAENTPMSQKRNSECWKTALNRNDLISIIRESMEKNRLCFQLNGKPQANVSPIRQQSPPQQLQPQVPNKQAQNQTRQKTKIPMLIANHNNRSSSFSNNNDSSMNEHHNSSHSNNVNIFHLQSQNISPLYKPQIGPIVSAAPNSIAAPNGQHSKMNLCGYDSFLHATICGGGRLNQTSPTHTKSSNNHQPNTMLNYNHGNHQQVATATVQPIMSSTFATNPQSVSKQMGLSTIGGPNQIKSSKMLRNGAHSQTHYADNVPGGFISSHNSPQYHGYQRLPSGNKHHLSPLNLLENHGSDKSQNEKYRSMQMQNYDLYAKLTEKLQQTSLAATNNSRESVQRRNKHQRVLRHRRSNATISHVNKVCVPTVASNEYTNLIPFCEDPVEFQNLIAQTTSDDESHSQHDEGVVANETTDSQNISNVASNTRNNVAEGTLVDLEDVDAEKQSHAANHCPIVSVDSNVNETHLEDELEIDDELDEDHLADLEEIAVTESGRNSSISIIEANEATIANTGANTSATSSLIHRYVHEHIHHHYHHFEEKDE